MSSAKIQHIIDDLLKRRAAGEGVDEKAVIGAHPELMPELGVALNRLAQIERALAAASPETVTGASASGDVVRSPSELPETVAQALGPFIDRPSPSVQIEGYDIVRELQRGGQGIVYQAVQRSTKRKVAIKVLLEGPYASASSKKRFEREIELVAQLKHPHITAVYHSGLTRDGHHYCVMDYVRGSPLNHYVRDAKPTLEDALVLFSKVCDAVNYAHQRGVTPPTASAFISCSRAIPPMYGQRRLRRGCNMILHRFFVLKM